MSIDPLAEKYPYNSTYAFQEYKMGLGRELEGLELASDLKKHWVDARDPETGNTDLLKFAGSFFTPSKPDAQKVSNEKTNVSLSTDNGGDENPKTTGPALEFWNVTSVIENMGSFAGLPGGKIKNGMTDAKKAATTIEKVKEGAELFKEGKDAAQSVEQIASEGKKGNTVLVEYVSGYRGVSKKNLSETESKKDSAEQAELGYKVIIERPKLYEINK
jgi:hypothetical protein